MVMQRTVTQEDEEEEGEIQKSPYPHENQGNEEES
jgi:hypothetical protein